MSDQVPSSLPACGLYRTTREVAGVPEGRLVYFHNHGDPGPGIYLPSGWQGNRATWEERGHTLPDPTDGSGLEAVAAEGFYRVTEAFHCCEKNCRLFEGEFLVQLGYNGTAEPILFTPEIADGVFEVPERGTRIDHDRIAKLSPLKVAMRQGSAPQEGPSNGFLH
ncbi:MAG: hypothetical protein JRH11_15570 [Deltaproteobacteria bacterium]|nr:hypothetical protein [Deltaproteobacteria bacterium]